MKALFPSNSGTLPRHPFVGLAIAACAGVILAEFWPRVSWQTLAVVGFCVSLALVRRSSLAAYATVAAGFFFLHSLSLTNTSGRRLAHELGTEPQTATVHGLVVTEPKFSEAGTASFLLRLSDIELPAGCFPSHATIFVRWKKAVQFGDELHLFGTAAPISPPRNPGQFDMRAYLAPLDVFNELSVGYEGDGVVGRHQRGNLILRAAQETRRWMQLSLTRGLDDAPDVQSLISGMVLGLRHQTPEDIEEPFQQTGTLHLFAVAGLHVGIVAQLLWIMATLLRLRRKWAIAFIVPALFFYATITGLHPSSVRAALMSSVLLGAFWVDRKALALNGLAAAAFLILCWNTNELFSIGFQLSFSVVTAIVLFADPIFRRLRRLSEPDPFLPRSLLSGRQKFIDRFCWWLMGGLAVSLAAWIGALPMMLWYYNLVTPISLLANLVVVPIAFFILATGLLSLLAAPISAWLSIIFNNANWAFAKIVLGIVHFFAVLPGSHFYVERPHRPLGELAEITVLDVGTGGAAHIRTAQGDWLFDSGSERDFEQVVRGYLHTRGINRLDGLLLSHGDASHIGGASSLWREFRPRRIIDSAAKDRSPIHRSLIALLDLQQFTRTILVAGQQLSLSPDIQAWILFPPASFAAKIADDQTFIVQIAAGERRRVLFTFDSGVATERHLLGSGWDLRSDIIVKGQHRSGDSGSPAYLDAVKPRAIIATSRDFPNSERISDEWAESLHSRGIKLFRQDECGAVSIQLFRDHWNVRAFMNGEELQSKTP